MKQKPLVSVIMNCHNGEEFLKDSISSVKNQTFKNWELVFFNNQSKDNSELLFKKIKDKRFKYFESKKLINLYHARQLAIKKTKGKYICFLDVDDLWQKNKLKKQVSLLEKNKADFIYSNYFILKKNKKKLFSKKKLPEGFITDQLLNYYFIPILTVIFKKSLLSKYKLNFDKSYKIIGDFDLFIKISKKVGFCYIHEPLATYRMHDNNFSKRFNNLYAGELKRWYKKNKHLFNIYKLNNFLLEIKYIEIKSNIYNSNFKRSLIEFIKFPICLKKLKLFILFFLPKKYFTF